MEDPAKWFAVEVRRRFEKLVASVLRNKGYQEFLPLCRRRSRWSDRIKEIEVPLFSGYLFCRFDPQYRLPILTTPGVIRIVGVGQQPVPVDEAELEDIRAVVHSRLIAEPCPYLRAGQRVRIEQGALAGTEGILATIKNQRRMVVSVTLLQRSVAVEIDEAWVKPVEHAGANG